MSKRVESWRLFLSLGVVFCCFGIVLWRVWVLSFERHAWYSRTAEAQATQSMSVLVRGNIYLSDKDGTTDLVAATKKFPVVLITPSRIPAGEMDRAIARIVEYSGNARDVVEKIVRSRADIARTLPKRLSDAQVQSIKGLGIKGVAISYEADRFYPHGNLAADVLGFLGFSGDTRKGQYGIEAYFDEELSGRRTQPGSMFGVASLTQQLKGLWGGSAAATPAPELDRPKDVILTIDKNVQAFVQDALRDLVAQYPARQATAIVQNPTTGEIIAMADWPTFDPNAYSQSPADVFLNGSVQQIFEPGSSFKPFTMAAGIDARKITPDTTYNDPGVVEINGFPIRNFDQKAHGVNTMTQVLEHSLNTGTMFVENLLGDDLFREYVVNLGFGQPTGIDLPGEVSGSISNLYSGRKVNFLTASFGQGVSVTPLQLIGGYSAIANGGKLMRPYVVDRIVSEGGLEKKVQPQVVGTPFTERTAATLRTMLTSVVDRGFDKARISGYDIAGKTGTAQIADGHGGYTEGEYIHSFVGFAPAKAPRFVVLVKLERPQGETFAANSLSPTFRTITAFLLNYYGVAPTRTAQ